MGSRGACDTPRECDAVLEWLLLVRWLLGFMNEADTYRHN